MATCMICGEEKMAKCHIIPRALFLDQKGSDKFLVGGATGREGLDFRQNGIWSDDLICVACEAKLGPADTYGVKITRKIQELKAGGAPVTSLDNPQPDLLMRFVLQCVWRPLAMETKRNPGSLLGRYSSVIEEAIFNNGSIAEFNCIVFRTAFSADTISDDIRAFVGPLRGRFLDSATWKISIFGVDFFLRVSGKKWPAAYLANDIMSPTGLSVFFMPPMTVQRNGWLDSIGRTLVENNIGDILKPSKS